MINPMLEFPQFSLRRSFSQMTLFSGVTPPSGISHAETKEKSQTFQRRFAYKNVLTSSFERIQYYIPDLRFLEFEREAKN